MQVSEVMTRDVRVTNPDETVREAACIMAELDCGAVPVGENDRLVGMVTDRDIAIRAVAEGRGPDTRVGEVMTRDVHYCFDDEDIETVCNNLGDQQIRRIPVVNREKRLVGILSLGDLALEQRSDGRLGKTLAEISRPGGQHTQAAGH